MKRAIFHGFLAGATLLAVYFLVMGFASGSWSYMVGQLVIANISGFDRRFIWNL